MTAAGAERMFRRVLVANRGEIACRIMATLRRLGIESVAVYSEPDRASGHVALADRAVPLGGSAPAHSYLRADRIVTAALESGAEAVHPGYGFLSESAAFARAVEAAGLVFVGPTPDQIEAFGDKDRARGLARAAGVPLLPGTDVLAGVEAALAEAERVGYPVMLKATAGGGGIGMAHCDGPDELAGAWDGVARTGQANFGSAALYLERFLPVARHVEVQVAADGRGGVAVFGDRDCSVQRRNQKVVEEAPAPDLPEALRQRLAESARALAASVAYRSVGTVEFLVDPERGAHHFLEVNTRLQVEHGVTELVCGVDLVEIMLQLAAGDASPVAAGDRAPVGHAVEARLYAEDPAKGFRPSAGLLTCVRLPAPVLPEPAPESRATAPTSGARTRALPEPAPESRATAPTSGARTRGLGAGVRVDTWVDTGTEVTPHYDPLLAKVLAHGPDRETAVDRLSAALGATRIDGIETNRDWVVAVLADGRFRRVTHGTRTFESLPFRPPTVEVVAAGGAVTVQDWPGRVGYWAVGVPPSGPMDDLSFRLGNRVVGNPEGAAGLECEVSGPTLRFNRPAIVCLVGAEMAATLDGSPVRRWEPIAVAPGSLLACGPIAGPGARGYVLFRGGVDVPLHLGSRATFTLGGFGGHGGRPLRPGDVLRLGDGVEPGLAPAVLPHAVRPELTDAWTLGVLDGPHAAPDFLTDDDVAMFYGTAWEVHYNSARTGVRLVGPAPQWARPDGGDAGLHPSNVHDTPYALGAVDLTGDMPVILGPDGPSLGGFVCPLTVAAAERWKLGQLRAGDTVRFRSWTPEEAAGRSDALTHLVATRGESSAPGGGGRTASLPLPADSAAVGRAGRAAPAVLGEAPAGDGRPAVTYRRSGDRYLLVEYGEPVLDLGLRVRAHLLMERLLAEQVPGVVDVTPGIRSLQVHVDGTRLTVDAALDLVRSLDGELPEGDDVRIPSRVVHLPLSWDDPATQEAIARYMRVVRDDAPWCPSNLEFIRRVNGLAGVEEVRRIVFDASYLVLGLGDVYLGAPVATPVDPRHRLVTTKYNPARTWTPENAVGIGGAYLCVYGMEGPGGYQFVGRTVPVWSRHRPFRQTTPERPWLLRFFDQIRFHPVGAEELLDLRADMVAGRGEVAVNETVFDLAAYRRFLTDHAADIDAFRTRQQEAFAAERERWRASGELDRVALASAEADAVPPDPRLDGAPPPDAAVVAAPFAAKVGQVDVGEGDRVASGDRVAVLEAMKMEVAVHSDHAGTVTWLGCRAGQVVAAGQPLVGVVTGA